MDRGGIGILTPVVIVRTNAASEHWEERVQYRHAQDYKLMAVISSHRWGGSVSRANPSSQGIAERANTADTSFREPSNNVRQGEGAAFPYYSGGRQLREQESDWSGGSALHACRSARPPRFGSRMRDREGKAEVDPEKDLQDPSDATRSQR